MKKYEVTALGELLIDFTCSGVSDQGNPSYEANPGGAPCNVLAMLNKMGHRTSFIGKVGDDIFGHQLKNLLGEMKIDTSNLRMDREVRTTLAFVANDEYGDRSFSFYRNPGADMMLRAEEIDEEAIGRTKILHFGTLSMTHRTARAATKRALKIAKERQILISFDPNLREMLWDSLDNAKKQTEYGLKFCDVLKISDNELQWFTGEEDYDRGVRIIQEKYHIPMILLSMGREGSRAYYKGMQIEVPGFIQENTIDTTGAGDTFFGCCLHFILKKGLNGFGENDLREMLLFANAAASIVTTRKGALRAMPSKEEVEELIALRQG